MRRYPWSRSRCARCSCRGPRPGFRLRPRPVGGEHVRCRLRRPASPHRQPLRVVRRLLGFRGQQQTENSAQRRRKEIQRFHERATPDANEEPSAWPPPSCDRGRQRLNHCLRLMSRRPRLSRRPPASATRICRSCRAEMSPARRPAWGWTVCPVAARAQGLGASHKLDQSIVIDKAVRELLHHQERPNGYCAYSGRPSACCCDSVGEGGVGWGVSGAM